jgi:GNAT superfamily N-acetyltransferase
VSVSIRLATRDDVPAVLGLYAASGIDAPADARQVAAASWHWDRLAAAGARVFLAEHEGRALGTLTLYVLPLLAHGLAPEALVEDVAVDAAAQGQGVGRALMHHAMGIARGHGCYKLALSSSLRREAAHAFYDSLGFERHGISFVVPLQQEPSQ